MSKLSQLTADDWDAIDYMGGWRQCRDRVDGILRNLGEHRSLLGEPPDELCDELIFLEGVSVKALCDSLFLQASKIQVNFGNCDFCEILLRHLVGAILDLLPNIGSLKHHGFSVADHSTERSADFHFNNVTIHVTTHPTEALIRKVAANLKAGLKPLVITLADGVSGANYLLKGTEWADRVDVLDVAQFLTANVYERSLFQAGECKVTLKAIIERYNQIVAECETDPVLRIRCCVVESAPANQINST
jgi:Domain of unknown function (DUF4928)